MQTLIETEQKKLIKKFHTLIGKVGGGNVRKEAILWRLGVEHTNELSVHQLIEECDALILELNPKLAELDKYRKRLMASIGGWLRAMSILSDGAKIKAIACRASQRDNFNDIPLEQLRSLYAAFNKKQRDLRNVELLTSEYIDILSTNN